MIINCTPHVVNILDENCCEYNKKIDGYYLITERPKVVRSFKPSGYIPRIKAAEDDVCMLEDIQVVQKIYGEIADLPPREENVWLIVSALVAKAGQQLGRQDLLFPTKLVRDKEGKVVGCLAFGVES